MVAGITFWTQHWTVQYIAGSSRGEDNMIVQNLFTYFISHTGSRSLYYNTTVTYSYYVSLSMSELIKWTDRRLKVLVTNIGGWVDGILKNDLTELTSFVRNCISSFNQLGYCQRHSTSLTVLQTSEGQHSACWQSGMTGKNIRQWHNLFFFLFWAVISCRLHKHVTCKITLTYLSLSTTKIFTMLLF
jgi:hypothetical protein